MTAPRSGPVALGFRVHSGWTALVAVALEGDVPRVVDRRRIELTDGRIPGAAQPYHAAEGLELGRAEKLVQRCAETAGRLALEGLKGTVAGLAAQGWRVVGCGLLLASGRPLPGLAATLASHALIHTADGEHFRRALSEAATRLSLPVAAVRERDLLGCCAERFRLGAAALTRRAAEMGKAVGPPWRRDEKLAALVAWLVLAGGRQAPRSR